MHSRPPVLRFGKYELDLDQRRLSADGVPLSIGSRGFDLLVQLARHTGRTVSSEDLLRAVWSDREVGANNLRVQITALRKLLGENVIAHHTTRGYRLTLPVLDEAEPAPSDQPPLPGNLPAHLPPLFGREDDRARLGALLTGQARVTLSGPAGVGKTALAQAAAHDQRAQPADGVWWIELAALTEGPQVAYGVAAMLKIKLQGQAPVDELARALAGKHVLLVLDNCEHLTRPVCDLADALLRHAPKVTLLATSRRSLKCAGEQLLRLESLALPDEPGLANARRSGAVALFEARARRAEPGFALTEANVDAVADICRQLDGLALAIGLAAARMPLLGVAGLRDRLGDRLRLLASREPDARGHPQALNAALDWSHDLLAPEEQVVLRRLGIFAGSFGLVSVQALVGDASLDEWAVLDALNALIDHSLLTSDGSALQSSSAARYSLHESVRLYARQRLDASGEAPDLQRRHAEHLVQLLTGEVRPAGVSAPRDRMDICLVDADHGNLRAALAWAADHDFDLALKLAYEAGPYLRQRCHHPEGRRLGLALLDDPRSAALPLLACRLHLGQTALCFEQSQLDACLHHAQQAIALAESPPPHDAELGEAYGWLGSIHLMRRQFGPAETTLRQAIAHERAAGNRRGEATVLNNIALLLVDQARHHEAQALLREALALNRALDSTWGTAITLENLGEAAYAVDDADAACAAWQEALPLVRRLGHVYHEALLLQYLAQAARLRGRAAEAAALLDAALHISVPQALHGLVVDGLVVRAGLAFDAGNAYLAAVLLRVSEQRRADNPANGPIQRDLARLPAAVRAALDEARWQAACIEGDRLRPEQAAFSQA